MNPIIKPVVGDQVVFELTDEDRRRLRNISLRSSSSTLVETVESGMRRMCIMQAIAALTTEASRDLRAEEKAYQERLHSHRSYLGYRPLEPEGYQDHPVCVSEQITQAMITLNDIEDISQAQRLQLKTLVEDILNTCPVSRRVEIQDDGKEYILDGRISSKEYQEAERKREEILAPILGVSSDLKDDFPPFSKCLQRIREAAAVYHVEVQHG